MILMPMVYVSDTARSAAFYEKLGFVLTTRGRTGSWVELAAGGSGEALLALHQTDELPDAEGRVRLSLVATEPLRELEDRLRAAGVEVVRPVTDEGFGYSMEVRDPDGLLVQINQHEKELYA